MFGLGAASLARGAIAPGDRDAVRPVSMWRVADNATRLQRAGPRCEAGSIRVMLAAPASRPASMKDDPRAVKWRSIALLALVLIGILVVAALVIVRFSRRFRGFLLRKPGPPTANEDVWAMHRLPPDEDAPLAEDAAALDDFHDDDDDDDGDDDFGSQGDAGGHLN